jgi:hypothetical protein
MYYLEKHSNTHNRCVTKLSPNGTFLDKHWKSEQASDSYGDENSAKGKLLMKQFDQKDLV